MFKKKTSPDVGDAPSRRRIVVILGAAALAVVVLVGGLVAVIGSSGLRSMLASDGPDSAIPATTSEGAETGPRNVDLVVMPFEEMIVNIAATAEPGRQASRFMRLGLALVYDQTMDTAGLVETRHIYMRDAFQDYLRHLTDRDIEGTLGLVTVKSELLRRARAIAGSNAPHEVLVLELLVQ